MSDLGEGSGKPLTFQQLAVVRRNTEAISQFLQQRLLSYLDTLRFILLPERLLGKHVGFKGEVAGIDKALDELKESFKAFSGAPYHLPKEFESEWLGELGPRLEIYRWEYPCDIQSEGSLRVITISSPVRWILTYVAPYSFAQMVHALSHKENRRADYMRQFVIHALIIKQLVSRSSGLQTLFQDLGFDLKVEFHPSLPQLPLIVITSKLPSFRPADDLVATATALSGVSAFIELIDIDFLENAVDPLKQQVAELLAKQ